MSLSHEVPAHLRRQPAGRIAVPAAENLSYWTDDDGE